MTAEQRELMDQSKQSSTFGSTSLIERDNADLMSSVSFNIDMLRGLDSISQTGESRDCGNDFDVEQLDLGAVKYELQARDKKIKDLLAEKAKMKGLLKKAKVAVESINNKQKLAEQKIAIVEAEKAVVAKQLAELQKRRNGIDKGQVA